MRAWIAEEAEFGHLFYWCPVLMGIGAVSWFSAAETPSAPAIIVFFLVFSGCALALRYRRPVIFAATASVALICAGALLAAWERCTRRYHHPRQSGDDDDHRDRYRARGHRRWPLALYRVELAGTEKPEIKRRPARVTLTAPGGKSPIALGATVRGRARLLSPSGPALAGLNDFAFDAYFAGTGAIGFFYGTPETIAKAQAGSLQASIRVPALPSKICAAGLAPASARCCRAIPAPSRRRW